MNRIPRFFILPLTLAAIAALPTAAAAAARCDGRKATVVGSDRGERIVAKPRDVIVSRGGDDRVEISYRNVVACLGPGRDDAEFSDTTGGDARVFGQAGNDEIVPSEGDLDYAQVYLEIVAAGGPGDDLLVGAYAGDRLSGERART